MALIDRYAEAHGVHGGHSARVCFRVCGSPRTRERIAALGFVVHLCVHTSGTPLRHIFGPTKQGRPVPALRAKLAIAASNAAREHTDPGRLLKQLAAKRRRPTQLG